MPALGITATWGAEEWTTFVLEHLAVESVLLRSGARFVPIAGRVAHVPRVLTDGIATWTAEATEIASSAPTGDQLVLTPKKIANVLVLSRESVEDAPVGELNETGSAMTRSIAVALDAVAFSNTVATATQPAGLRSLALTAQTGGTVTLPPYINAVGKIQSVGGTANAIYVSPADMTTLRLLVQATGSNVPLITPDPTQAFAERLAGCTLYPTPALPTGTAIVADSRQIVVGIRRAIRVEFSTEQKFSADSIVAKITARLDYSVNDLRGIVAVGP